ncbi:MFS transporter [Peribacillus sp. JNUCC41]|uniref:MFS transporter n=1 Tax=Peribacillus sp. JNUCC41 TaxID=2778370 RepID=UPI00177DCD7E|nr:MFS transporter [Brevibacillus sp. JNUCC-41]QOS88773.1 MHS family MFS transporter [Brevibacillus sp. JNUCC-41]
MSSNETSMKRVAGASFVGALMEWYDFFLYGTASAIVLNKLFFPDLDPTVGTIAAFASFAIGFLARPLGGLVFGHFGDKIGRKSILVITLLMMGGSTFAIGLLPTYDSIGVWAPILLVALRLFQGFALGGEYGGASLLMIEHAPRNQRGFWGALLQSATPLGLLLASGTFTLVTLLPEAQFLAWGWRIPFVISIILLGVGTFIRFSVKETPAFQELKETGKEVKLPIVELFRAYPKSILIAFGARIGETVSFNLFNVFVISYVNTKLGLSSNVALTGVFVASAVAVVVSPLFGALSDRIGRKPVYLFGTSFLVLFAFPFFSLVNSGVAVIIYLAITLGYVLGTTALFSIQSVFFTEMFGTHVRYSGLSFVYQVSGIIGGFTPLIASSLLLWEGGVLYISLFLVCASLISLIATLFSKETFKKDISEIEKLKSEVHIEDEIKILK